MAATEPGKIRNVAVVGHRGTGKTSLVEALLFQTGEVNRLGTIEAGTTVSDSDEDEQRRAVSISLSLTHTEWQGRKINLLDCPGYGIFFSETKAGMRAADAVLVCVSAVAGVEVNTEKVAEFAAEIGLPTAICLTKMDRERADFERAVASIQEHFGRGALPIQIPIGSEKGFRGLVDLVTGKAVTFLSVARFN